MKHGRKPLRYALILLLAGVVIFAAGYAASGFDFAVLDTRLIEENTVEIGSGFSDIDIVETSADISFVLSEDGKCRVSFLEDAKCRHSAAVEGGTLVIRQTDDRRWYDLIGLCLRKTVVTVSLPPKTYGELRVETSSGDVDIPAGLAFADIAVRGSTSDVRCSAAVEDALDIEVSTGGIKLEDVDAGALKLRTTTGSIALDGVECASLFAACTTGDIRLKDILSSGAIEAGTTTGDIVLDNSDAASLDLRTSTGDVSGSLSTLKSINAESSTGSVSVPQATEGGTWVIRSSTGDIRITAKDNKGIPRYL